MQGLLKCYDKRTDCFARTEQGKCHVLKGTKFDFRICPFYKPADTVDLDEIEESIREYDELHAGEGQK